MAIYTESAVQYNGVQTESIEDIINDDRVVPSKSDDFISEGMEVILGMTENYNMVMEHVGRSELLALEQTGEPLVYTEGVIGSIFSTIKKFLSKIWEKIKSLFKRFIMMIDSYTKNDKAFITKYRQQIYRHKSLSDFTFKGYVYTIDIGKIKDMMGELNKISKFMTDQATTNPSYTGSVTSDNLQKDIIDKLDDVIEAYRGDVLAIYPKGKKGKYTSEEFRKEFKELLRNGESEKQDLDGNNGNEIDVNGMVTELQNYRETKKAVDTAYKESKKAIDEDNKTVDRLSKEHSKSDDYKNTGDTDDDYETENIRTIPIIKRINDADANIDLNHISALFKSKGYEFADHSQQTDFDNKLKNAMKNRETHFDSVLVFKDRSKIINSGSGNKSGITKGGVRVGVDLSYESDRVVAKVSIKEKHKRQGKYIQMAFRIINQTKQCLVDIDTTVLQALKERSRQYKACLVKIVYHNPKNEESYNESYYYNDGNRSYVSPLASIEFK